MDPEQQALTYLRQGYYEKAESFYQNHLTTETFWYLGLCYLLQGQPLQAQLIWAESLPQDQANRLELWLHQEAIYHHTHGYLAHAERIYKQLIELNPTAAIYYDALGSILIQFREFRSAIDYLNQALHLDPYLRDTHLQLGKAYQQVGEILKAIDHFEQAIKQDDTQSQPYYELGRCWIRLQDWPRAESALQRALRIATALDSVEVSATLAHLYFQSGDPHRGILYLHKAVQENLTFFKTLCEYSTGSSFLLEVLLNAKDISQSLDDWVKSRWPKDQRKDPVSDPLQDPYSQTITPQLRLEYHLSELKGFERTQDYLNQAPQKGSISSLAAAHIIPLKGSIVANFSDQEINTRLRNIALPSPETFVLRLNHGQVHIGSYPDHPYANYGSAVIAQHENDPVFLADLSPCLPPPQYIERPYQTYLLNHHPFLSLPHLPPPLPLSGTIALLPLGGMNYFHWIVDVLPAFGLIQNSGWSWTDIDYFLIHGYTGKPFQQDSLARLGIPTHKIINTAEKNKSYIQAQQWVIPSLPGHPGYLTQWAAQFSQSLLIPPGSSPSPSQKIYISRKQARWRRVVNEPEVTEYLQSQGFTIVSMETLSLAEQITLMQSARQIIGLHGAGLTNMVFCRPNTQVLEIFPRYSVLPYFWVIANQLQITHHSLLGEVCQSPTLCQLLADPILDREDTWVDLEKLKTSLERMDP
jgi:tetratricopeptide (TPR) repeat protein